MAKQSDLLPNDKKMQDFKVEQYLIKERKLYKTYYENHQGERYTLRNLIDTSEIEQTNLNMFFNLFNEFSCHEFIVYYVYNYEIETIFDCSTTVYLNLNEIQLNFLRKFFLLLQKARIYLFDKKIKPFANDLVNSENSSGISNNLKIPNKSQVIN